MSLRCGALFGEMFLSKDTTSGLWITKAYQRGKLWAFSMCLTFTEWFLSEAQNYLQYWKASLGQLILSRIQESNYLESMIGPCFSRTVYVKGLVHIHFQTIFRHRICLSVWFSEKYFYLCDVTVGALKLKELAQKRNESSVCWSNHFNSSFTFSCREWLDTNASEPLLFYMDCIFCWSSTKSIFSSNMVYPWTQRIFSHLFCSTLLVGDMRWSHFYDVRLFEALSDWADVIMFVNFENLRHRKLLL